MGPLDRVVRRPRSVRMDKVQEWNELAAQFAVDGIRARRRPGRVIPRPRCPPRTCSPSCTPITCGADVGRSEERRERPVRAVEGPRVAADVLGPEGRSGAITDEQLLSFRKFGSRSRDTRCRSPTCRGSTWPRARSARGCPIGLGMALAMKLDEQPGPRVGADGRLRGGRGLGVGGHGERVVPSRGQPRRDPRHESAGSARPDHARVARRRLRGAGPGVRLERRPGRRPRRRGRRPRVHERREGSGSRR